MSRITGSEVASLMEAYQAVYAPQELTEEQVWEEVENWVNSLLEEGYDLSEYTWEEMYESYIEEAPMTAFQAAGGQAKLDQINKNRSPGSGRATAASIEKQGQENLFKAGGGQAAIDKGPKRNAGRGGMRPTLTRQDIINKGTVAAAKPAAKPAAPAARPAAAAPAARPAAAAPAARPAAAPAARPAAAAPTTPKVSPSTPAKPAGPAMGKLGGTTFERRTPTSAELKAAQSARASGASPEKALQAAKSAGGALSQATAAASKPAAFSPTPVAAKTAPTPVTPKQTPRQARLNMEMEYDTFDSILEHLIAEGYADNEEAAFKIMANMSEEWRQSIMEGPGGMMMSAASRGKGQLVQNKPTPKTSQPSGGAPGGMIRSMMSK